MSAGCYWCARDTDHDFDCPGLKPQPSHEPELEFQRIEPDPALVARVEELRRLVAIGAYGIGAAVRDMYPSIKSTEGV